MKREFLEGLGLAKEAIDSIMAEHGKSIETKKAEVTNLNSTLEDVKSQLAQRDKDLSDLKKQADGNKDLQQKFTDLEAQYKTDKEKLEKQVKETQQNSAIKLALAGKVHDADLVASLIDKGTIDITEDGKISKGLDEQIKTLQESKSFLFVSDKADPIKGIIPGDGKPGGDDGKVTEGSIFAKAANESSKPAEKSIWD